MSSFRCIRLGILMPLSAIIAVGQFVVTPFDVIGNNATFPTAINNNGEVAGTFTNITGGTSGFIRMADGTITTFDLSSIGGSLSTVTGINDLGQVAGTGTIGGLRNGFIRDAQGNIATFGSPYAGFVVESVVGLNNAGESIVTLFASNINGGATELSTFLRTSANSYDPLPSILPPPSAIYGLNNNGEAVGTQISLPGGQSSGFVLDLSSQAFTFFNFSTALLFGAAGPWTLADAVNDPGEVLGYYLDGVTWQLPSGSVAGGAFQGVNYIREPGGSLLESFALPFPSNSSKPAGINQAREITGTVTNAYGTVGYIAVPTTSTASPVISLVQIVPGPPDQAVFSVVDPVSGIYNVLAIGSNCTVEVGPFSPGQTTPVTVTAVKTDQTMAADVAIQGVNFLGATTDFDPAFVTIYGNGRANRVTLTDIPLSEHVLKIANGAPGLKSIKLHVNSQTIEIPLKPAEKRTLNLKAWMSSAGNTIDFAGEGPTDQLASVVLNN